MSLLFSPALSLRGSLPISCLFHLCLLKESTNSVTFSHSLCTCILERAPSTVCPLLTLGRIKVSQMLESSDTEPASGGTPDVRKFMGNGLTTSVQERATLLYCKQQVLQPSKANRFGQGGQHFFCIRSSALSASIEVIYCNSCTGVPGH